MTSPPTPIRARRAVGHHALRRGNDGHAQAVHHARQIFATDRCRCAGRDGSRAQALDDRTTGVMLDVERSLASFRHRTAKPSTTSLVLRHLGDRQPSAWTKASTQNLLGPLAVADARQHVGDRIAHTHLRILLTSSPWSCPALRRASDLAQLVAAQTELAEDTRGRPVSAQRLRWQVGLALRGSCCRARRAAMRSSSDRLVS